MTVSKSEIAEKTPEKTPEKAPEKAAKPKPSEAKPSEAKPSEAKAAKKTEKPAAEAEKPAKNKAAKNKSDSPEAKPAKALVVIPDLPPDCAPRTYASVADEDRDHIFNIQLGQIYVPDYDSRIIKAAVDDNMLADMTNGQRTPILVSPMVDPANMFELIDGRRRYEAAKKLGWKTIRAQYWEIKGGVAEAYELSIAANNNRENLSAFENAVNADRLMKRYGYTQEKIAKALGKTGPYVSQLMAMLRLPAEILEMIRERRFGAEHGDNILGKARAICRLKELDQQKRVAELACRTSAPVVIDCVRVFCAVRDKDTEAAKKEALFGKSNLDPRVAEMALYGKLEPDTVRRCQAISKIRAYDQQFEMAQVLSDHTERALEAHEPVPSLEDLESWIDELRKQTAAQSDDDDKEETAAPRGGEFKPLTASQMRDKFEELKLKFDRYAKSEGADALKIAKNTGILRGLRIAGGLA